MPSLSRSVGGRHPETEGISVAHRVLGGVAHTCRQKRWPTPTLVKNGGPHTPNGGPHLETVFCPSRICLIYCLWGRFWALFVQLFAPQGKNDDLNDPQHRFRRSRGILMLPPKSISAQVRSPGKSAWALWATIFVAKKGGPSQKR